MPEPTLIKFKNEKEEFANSVSHLKKRKSVDSCLDASFAIAMYLKTNFLASSQKEVLLKVHTILENWYVEKIAGARDVLEKQEEDLKIFKS